MLSQENTQPISSQHWEAVTITGVLPGIDPKTAPILLRNCTSNNTVLGLLPKVNPAPQEDYTLMNSTPERKVWHYNLLTWVGPFWTSPGYFCSDAHWRWFWLGLLSVFFVLLCFVLSSVAKGGLELFPLLKEEICSLSACEIWPAHFSAEEWSWKRGRAHPRVFSPREQL